MFYTVRIEPTPSEKNRYADEQDYRKKQLRAAKTLNLISGIGTGVALAALLALIYNAILIHRQWGAMVESNNISHSSLVISQRAFVFVPTDFTEISGTDAKTGTKVGAFTFRMENSGNTPATVNGNHISTNYDGPWEKLPSNFDFPDLSGSGPFPNTNTGGGKIIIAPHQSWDFQFATTRETLFPLVNTGKAHVYFWGWIGYTDVFGCPHKTEFARELTSVQRVGPKNEQRFFIDNLGQHNCIDTDCNDYKPPNIPSCPN